MSKFVMKFPELNKELCSGIFVPSIDNFCSFKSQSKVNSEEESISGLRILQYPNVSFGTMILNKHLTIFTTGSRENNRNFRKK